MDRKDARGRMGSHPWTVWLVKHAVSPIDRWLVRISKGRLPPLSAAAVPTLMLTTTGRTSGQERAIPLVYIRVGSGFVVANARPRGERQNPWVLNLRTSGSAKVRVGGTSQNVTARLLDDSEAAKWWPALNEVWPAFDRHYVATGERSVFMLEVVGSPPRSSGRPIALVAVKAIHTAIWFTVEAAMIYVIAAGFAGRTGRRVAIASGIVTAETAVFLANGARCPLTGVAESLGAERGSATDIFLPRAFARNLPVIHVPLVALAIYLHAKRFHGPPTQPDADGAS